LIGSNGDARRSVTCAATCDDTSCAVHRTSTRRRREPGRREKRGRPPPRGVVETKPVLPRGRESHALSAVYGRNEERACVRASSQKRQEVVGSVMRSTVGPTSRGSLIKLSDSPRRPMARRWLVIGAGRAYRVNDPMIDATFRRFNARDPPLEADRRS